MSSISWAIAGGSCCRQRSSAHEQSSFPLLTDQDAFDTIARCCQELLSSLSLPAKETKFIWLFWHLTKLRMQIFYSNATTTLPETNYNSLVLLKVKLVICPSHFLFMHVLLVQNFRIFVCKLSLNSQLLNAMNEQFMLIEVS